MTCLNYQILLLKFKRKESWIIYLSPLIQGAITSEESVKQAQKEVQLFSRLLKDNIQPVSDPYETEGINFAYRIDGDLNKL